MSIILALDTSTDACSVALNQNGEITSSFEIAAQSHTQRLLPMVNEILADAKLKLSQLDAIAFGRGPGSFTGLRICAGIVQGLAFGANIPVIPISTLRAMALQYFREHASFDGVVLSSLDARMSEVYWGLYQRDAQALCVTINDEQVAKPAGVVAKATHKNIVGVGSGWNYPELAELNPLNIEATVQPRAEEIVLLAAVELNQGRVVDALGAQPVYLRDSVSWQKRKRIRDNSID